MSYDDLSDTYNMNGGCAEMLIPSTNLVKISKRNKIEENDVLVFTCIPKDEREQDRIVYGCGVVKQVVSKDDYNEVYLNPDLSYFSDYDNAVENKFWNVSVNTTKPGVMLFGNSHCKRLRKLHSSILISWRILEWQRQTLRKIRVLWYLQRRKSRRKSL